MAKIKEETREETRREEVRPELNPTEMAKRIIMFMMFCKKIGLFFRTELFLAFKEFESSKEGWLKFAFLFKIEDKQIKISKPLSKEGMALMSADKFLSEEQLGILVEMLPLEEFEEFLTVEAKYVEFEDKTVYAIIFDLDFKVAQERLGELEDEEEEKERTDA